MLVPVMVLGIMGCGGTPETGTESPYILHGTWVNTAITDNPYFVLTANELTVVIPVLDTGADPRFVQYAFKAEYGVGSTELDATSDEEFTLFLTRIVDGIEWGTLEMTFNGAADTITVDKDVVFEDTLVPYYEFNGLLLEATYTRAAN